MSRHLALALLLAALLAACSTPPETLSNQREGITLSWDPAKTSRSAADEVAQEHCTSWGKQAGLLDLSSRGSQQLARYACR